MTDQPKETKVYAVSVTFGERQFRFDSFDRIRATEWLAQIVAKLTEQADKSGDATSVQVEWRTTTLEATR